MWVRLRRWTPERKAIGRTYPAEFTYSWHKRGCAEAQVNSGERHRKWVNKYPGHCTECFGVGSTCWTENLSPLGSGHYWPQTMCDSCICVTPADIEEMVCPRCGEKLYHRLLEVHAPTDNSKWLVDTYGKDGVIEDWLEQQGPCPFCGWKHGLDASDFAPELSECMCWDDLNMPHESAIPPRFQRLAFALLDHLGQRFFKHPIIAHSKKEVTI